MSDLAAKPLEGDEFARLMDPFIKADFGKITLKTGCVAVAVSGGADSLALAVLTADWGRAVDVRVVALSVDHGLRAESRSEVDQVGRWLSRFGMDHHILTWRDGAAVSGAVQERARNARYGLLGAWCRGSAATLLLTAHHQDDQAETFLMRLKRGSTLFGLAAMAPARPLSSSGTPSGDVTLCRPFLDVPKARLVATLVSRGQVWIEDPSNADRKFERVRVRAMMRPLAESGVTASRLAGAARAARSVTQILDRGIVAFEAAAVQHCADGVLLVDAAAFAALPKPLQVRAMSQFLCRLGGGAYAPRQVKMRRLLGWLALRAEAVPGILPKALPKARTLAGCIIERGVDTVRIKKEVPRQRGRNGKIPLFFHQRSCSRRLKDLHPC